MPIQIPNIYLLTVINLKFPSYSFQIFLLLYLKYPLAPRLTLFRLYKVLWLGSCTQRILVCFL